MDLHFYDWIDYNGIAFSTEFPTELLELGRKLSGFWWDLKMERFVVKKGCCKKNCSAVDLIFACRITFRFGSTIKALCKVNVYA